VPNKYLFISETGDGCGLAMHLQRLGHSVMVHIRERKSALNYDGLLPKVTNWEKFLDKDTVVIFDSSGGGKTGDRLRAKGQAVFMGSVFADQLELDRDLAFEFMKQVGIKVPHSEEFTNWEAGRQFAKRHKGRLVFKPNGALAKDDKTKSYVASDDGDMIEMLNYYERIASKPPSFELQEFHKGIAVSTEGWFNGHEFMKPFNHTIERKAVMNDDLGGSGGCSGNIVWAWPYGSNHVIEDGIARMSPVLEEYGYVGPIDLNTIVAEDGVWALEFTPRFGYDAMPTLLELYTGDFGELLASLARGERPREMVLKSGFGSGLRITVPPFPAEQFRHEGGVPVRGFDKGWLEHCYFFEVMINELGSLVTAPAYGSVVCITSQGSTIEDSFNFPYHVAKEVRIPNKQYRTDLISSLGMDHARLMRMLEIRRREGEHG